MPTVPVIQQRVQEAGIPGVRVQTDAPLSAFGGGAALENTGRAVNNALDVGIGIAEKAKNSADQLAIMEYDQKLSDLHTRLEYNPNEGFRNKKGKSSLDAQDYTMKEWDKGVEELSKTLNNDAQRMAAAKLTSSRFSDINKSLTAHVSKELQEYDTQTYKSYLDNEKDSAAKNYKSAQGNVDVERIGNGVYRQQVAIQAFADRNGMPPEWVKQTIRTENSKLHEGVINRMIDSGDDLAAKEYFNQVKADMDVDTEHPLAKSMRASSIKGEAQRQSDAIIASSKSMEQALAEVRKIKEPEVRDSANDRVKEYYSLKEQAVKRDNEQKYQLASSLISKGKEVPTTLMESLPPAEQKSLMEFKQYKVEGGFIPTNQETKYSLIQMAGNNPKAFAEENLLMYQNKLNTTDLSSLMDLQRKVRTGEDKALTQLNRLNGETENVNRALGEFKINPNPKPGTPNAQKVAEFRSRVNEIAVRKQLETGKPIGDEDLYKISQSLLTDITVKEKGIFWGENTVTKKLYQLKPGEEGRISAKGIPPRDLSLINKYIKDYNRPDTDEERILQYNKILKRRGVR